jgi:predicted RNA methylase
MSATNRGAERQADDFYATPTATTRALLRHYDVRGKRVLEPGCGTGSIVRELVAAGAHVIGVELDVERAGRTGAIRYPDGGRVNVACGDYLESLALPEAEKFDYAIGNPPFSLALPFVQKALTQAHTVCMLLRLNWLGSKERSAFHEANPSHVRVLDTRPAFVASLKCGGIVAPCGWRRTQAVSDPVPKDCPGCGAGPRGVSRTTTDATEYAWFCWSADRSARWSILRERA